MKNTKSFLKTVSLLLSVFIFVSAKIPSFAAESQILDVQLLNQNELKDWIDPNFKNDYAYHYFAQPEVYAASLNNQSYIEMKNDYLKQHNAYCDEIRRISEYEAYVDTTFLSETYSYDNLINTNYDMSFIISNGYFIPDHTNLCSFDYFLRTLPNAPYTVSKNGNWVAKESTVFNPNDIAVMLNVKKGYYPYSPYSYSGVDNIPVFTSERNYINFSQKSFLLVNGIESNHFVYGAKNQIVVFFEPVQNPYNGTQMMHDSCGYNQNYQHYIMFQSISVDVVK